MSFRTMFGLVILICIPPVCLADTIILKDGTKKEVRIYKTAPAYLSYLYKGRIEVIRRDKVKKLLVTGKALTDKDLAGAIKKWREDARKKIREEEKKNGIAPGKAPAVKSLMDPKKAGKGVRIIMKGRSKTKATELMIDPFPDHPVTDRKNQTSGKKAGKKQPAGNVRKKQNWRADR